MKLDIEEIRTVLVTDCGSTTTKALLFSKTKDGWRKTSRGEAPTTVEEPVADVTVGALNAFTEIQEISGRKILKVDNDQTPFEVTDKDENQGIDLYLSTSSAGGGLQMMVTGIVPQMTTESAERAALGAGAIVLEALSADDNRNDFEQIERIRHLKPDIVLITGGVDGGSVTHVEEMAELILAAAPKPRFGETLMLPIIYAGNKDAASDVCDILKDIAQVSVVENIRPTLDVENLVPAREEIHEFFLTHVMSHSPGYDKLLSWSPKPVMPTPAAVGDIVSDYAKRQDIQVLCADIGGATTDVFSVFKNEEENPVFNRTVSANLGMSYSIANVLLEAGAAAIKRWLPYEIAETELRDRLRNKMIRPTSIPQTKDDLWLEQAVCREALRLSLIHHRSLAVGLSGTQKQKGIADIFSQTTNRYELVDMIHLDLVIGSGGVLSHAPQRLEAALMMLDGFELAGVTEITVDSIFMMPHLGVLSSVHPKAAEEIFVKDCLVHIAHAVVPIYPEHIKKGIVLAEVYFNETKIADVKSGELELIKIEEAETGKLIVRPSKNKIDVGEGPGKDYERVITIGSSGIICDGRNRPIYQESSEEEQIAQQEKIYKIFGLM